MFLVSSPKIFLISFITATCFFIISSITIAQDFSSNKNFKFYMSAVAKVVNDANPQIIPLINNMILKSGDLIKFYFEFGREGYLYIFHENPRADLALIFPKELDEAKIQNSSPFFIPEGIHWVELDSDTGRETFYLIVSSLQLEQLEFLYCNHIKLKEIEEIKQSAQSILAQIKSISRQSLRKQAEKPLRIAGKLRGNLGNSQTMPQELFNLASEITTDRTFVKTIIINHK